MIVVDVEATGLDPAIHSLVSIGAVDFAHPERQFYRECRLRKGARLDAKAMAVHGISKAQLRDPAKPSIKQVLLEFLEWSQPVADRILMGQNPAFDRDMLKLHARRCRIKWPFGHRTVDLHSVCYAHMLAQGFKPPAKYGFATLGAGAIYGYVGLPEEARPHHALTGALMEAEAFARLIYGKSIIPTFFKYSIPTHLIRK